MIESLKIKGISKIWKKGWQPKVQKHGIVLKSRIAQLIDISYILIVILINTPMTSPTISTVSSIALGKSLLRTLIYFDVFKHPLTGEELANFCDEPHSSQELVEQALRELEQQGMIFCHQGFYSVSGQEVRAIRRVEANKRASRYLKWAYRFSRMIGAFPFVRGVLISGSLSKRCAYKDSDIDYVVITKAEHIWFVRGVLRLMVKLLFFQRFRKYFCLNYFMDEDHLQLNLKNHYIASEMAFLIPTYGKELYHQLWSENAWVRTYYPNFPKEDTSIIPSSSPSIFKHLLEKLLNNSLVRRFNRWYQSYSAKNWETKQQRQQISKSAHLAGKEGEIKSFSFGPEAFMSIFQQRIAQFEEKHGVNIGKN